MNIAFVIGSLSGGGAERVVARLASQFSKNGHSVTVYMIAKNLIEYDIDANVKTIFIKPTVSIRGVKYLERAYRLRQEINHSNHDVIISFTSGVSSFVMFALKGTKHRVILSERNNPYTDPHSPKMRKKRDQLYEKADGIVFQTQDAKNYFSQAIQSKSIVIVNPIGDDIPLPYEGERESVLVSVGRLEPQKNHKLLIDASFEVQKQYPSFTLKIYGEGALKKQLEEQVTRLNLQNKVHLMGHSKNVLNDIKKATAFILPSDYEGISNALIEAMAIGLPVVSTDHPIGGARLLIDPGNTGLLSPVGDKDALVQAILKILSDRTFANKISSKALDVRRIASISSVANEWLLFINKTISNK